MNILTPFYQDIISLQVFDRIHRSSCKNCFELDRHEVFDQIHRSSWKNCFYLDRNFVNMISFFGWFLSSTAILIDQQYSYRDILILKWKLEELDTCNKNILFSENSQNISRWNKLSLAHGNSRLA